MFAEAYLDLDACEVWVGVVLFSSICSGVAFVQRETLLTELPERRRKGKKNQLLEAERCFSTFLSLLYCVDVLDNVNIIQVQLLLKFGCACSGLLSPYWSFSSKWCLFNSQSQWYPLYQKWHFLTIRILCDRIEAKHQELRDREVQNRFCPPDVEDDDLDPNYARINTFRERGSPSQPIYGNRSPSPQRPTPPVSHNRDPSTGDPLDGLYAKVNKQRNAPPPAADK